MRDAQLDSKLDMVIQDNGTKEATSEMNIQAQTQVNFDELVSTEERIIEPAGIVTEAPTEDLPIL